MLSRPPPAPASSTPAPAASSRATAVASPLLAAGSSSPGGGASDTQCVHPQPGLCLHRMANLQCRRRQPALILVQHAGAGLIQSYVPVCHGNRASRSLGAPRGRARAGPGPPPVTLVDDELRVLHAATLRLGQRRHRVEGPAPVRPVRRQLRGFMGTAERSAETSAAPPSRTLPSACAADPSAARRASWPACRRRRSPAADRPRRRRRLPVCRPAGPPPRDTLGACIALPLFRFARACIVSGPAPRSWSAPRSRG